MKTVKLHSTCYSS